MNLDLTAEEEDALIARVPKAPSFCPHPFCGEKGHKTTRSKACKANPERLLLEGNVAACAAVVAAANSVVAPVLEETAEAQDLNRHEAVPLCNGDDDSSIDMYEEADTWSEDEEGNVI